jgi:hypothetical protein
MNNFEEHFNIHFIRTRPDNAITQAWSDGPKADENTDGAIVYNAEGRYQLHLLIDGTWHENPWPDMWDDMGVPLLKHVGGLDVTRRSETEIQAERDEIIANQPPPLPRVEERLAVYDKRLEWCEESIKAIVEEPTTSQQLRQEVLGLRAEIVESRLP